MKNLLTSLGMMALASLIVWMAHGGPMPTSAVQVAPQTAPMRHQPSRYQKQLLETERYRREVAAMNLEWSALAAYKAAVAADKAEGAQR